MLKHWEATKRRSMLRSTDNLPDESSDYGHSDLQTLPSKLVMSGASEYHARGAAKDIIMRRKPMNRERPKSTIDLRQNDVKHKPLKMLSNEEVCEWIKCMPSESLEDVAIQIKTLGVTGKQMANPDFVTNLLQEINFQDSERRQSFLLKLLQRIRDEEQSKRPRNTRSKSVKTRKKRIHKEEAKRKLSDAFVSNENVTYSMTLKENVPNFAHVRTLSTGHRNDEGEKEKVMNKRREVPPVIKNLSKNIDNRLCRSTESLVTSSDYVSSGSLSATASDTPHTATIKNVRVKKNLAASSDKLSILSSNDTLNMTRRSPLPSYASSSSTSSFPVSNSSSENISPSNKMKKKFAQLRDRMNLRISKPELTVKNIPNNSPLNKSTSTLHNIVLYSDINSPGHFASFELLVTTTTTALELIQMFLDSCSIVDDVNLYSLHEVSRAVEGTKIGNILSMKPIPNINCPHSLMENLTTNATAQTRIELIKDSGIMIKVICRIGQHRPRTKAMHVSNTSTAKQILKLSLRKFRLRNVDSSLFYMCELKNSGEIRDLNEESVPEWKTDVSYLITDKANHRPKTTDWWKNELLTVNGTNEIERSLSNSSKHSDLSSLSDFSQNSSAYESDNAQVPKLIPFAHRGSRTSHNPSTSSMFAEIGVTYDVIMSDEDDDCDVFYTNNEVGDNTNTLTPHTSSKHFVKSASTSTMLHSNDALRVDNAALRAQLHENEEKMTFMYKQTEQLRKMLESGLQDQLQFQQAITNGHGTNNTKLSVASIEAELKSLDQQINNTETLLSQLFRYQRKAFAQCVSLKANKRRLPFEQTLNENDSNNIDSLIDVEFKIATHQTNLISLKHKYHLLDMQMSLFVTQRKSEKFRQMCQSSLYDILSTGDLYKQQFMTGELKAKHRCNGDPRFLVYQCDLYAGSAGYGLSLMQDKGKNVDSGILVDTPHIQGRLKRGDRLIEINGINVQSSSTEFVAKLLKGTKSAKLVVLRKLPDNKPLPTTNGGNNTKATDLFEDAVDLV